MKDSNRMDDVTAAHATSVYPLTFPMLGQIACNMLGLVTDSRSCNTKNNPSCDSDAYRYIICI